MAVKRDQGLLLAIESVGSIRALARAIGMTRQAIQLWNTVPAKRVLDVERATGVHRAVLRPELFRGMERALTRSK